jgi:signal transduction histidine kinase
MPNANLAHLELNRLVALASYGLLDTNPEREFDDITSLAAEIFNAPIALVSLVDHDRQWFKSKCGLDVSETPRDVAFCSYAIRSPETMVVADASKDERFASNPLVTGEPNIRFYAGAPLRSPEGFRVGTLCIVDTNSREFSKEDISRLRRLANSVETLMNLRMFALQALGDIDEHQEILAHLELSLSVQSDLARRSQLSALRLTHELRGPLNAIVSSAAFLHQAELTDADNARRRQAIKTIAKGARDIAALSAAVAQDIAQPLTQAPDARVQLDLNDITANAVRQIAPTARANSIALNVHLSAEPCVVAADPARIKQVVLNLLSNSLKYIAQGGVIRVRTAIPSAGTGEVSVEDTGVGMTDEQIAEHVRPFANLADWRGQTDGEPPSSLRVGKLIAEQHGGAMTISSAVGRGTLVKLSLPLIAASQAEKERAA